MAGKDEVPKQVYQVRRSLLEDFTDLIDMSDFESYAADQREQALLSRSLAALAVRMVTGWGKEDAAASVIDGRDDQGIDAIAVTSNPVQVFLVQAKWSDRGRATVRTDSVLKLLAGLRLIDSEESDQFNPRGQLLAEQAKEAMAASAVDVTLVDVLMGTEKPSREVELAFSNGESEFNTFGDRIGHRFIHANDVWNWVRAEQAPAPVCMEVLLYPWFSLDIPHRAFQGVADAEQVAGWLEEHGSRLFERNIRNPLIGTLANQEIYSTLVDDPSLFWYFNNGVTVLCDEATPSYSSVRNPLGGPVTLQLRGASVVNGAQTVRSVQRAIEASDDAASARVGVRVIVTGGASDFSSRTTKATNRQNQVEPRDFVALDPVQAEIRADLRAELGKSYSVKRGEMQPAPETGCSLDEAAVALAYAHPNAEYASRTANSLSTLWERGSKGTYDILFRPQPSASQVWRSVLTVRRVRECMHELRPKYEALPAAILEHGTHLLCHLVFRALGTDGIDDPAVDWETDALSRVLETVETQLALLVKAFEQEYPKGRVQATLTAPDRCRQLAAVITETSLTGRGSAEVPDRYVKRVQARRRRRPNAVPTLVDTAAIAEGAPLTFVPMNAIEEEALREWLAEDPRRSRATWVNDRSKPLLWEADGRQHSPSGLVTFMWKAAKWGQRPVSNQGTARWQTSDGRTLAALAFALQDVAEPE